MKQALSYITPDLSFIPAHDETGHRGRTLEFRYKWKSICDSYRGWLFQKRWRDAVENESGLPLIVGSDLEFICVEADSKLILKGESPTPQAADRFNPYFPLAVSIAKTPHWQFLNRPVHRPTKISLRTGGKLIMHQNSILNRGSYVTVGKGAQMVIGPSSYIGHESMIHCREGITIGEGCLIGQEVMMMDYDGHPVYDLNDSQMNENFGGRKGRIEIGSNVWIGWRATILKGVSIGDGAIIATGAYVTSDVPKNSIVAGNPARVIREGITWKRY